MAKAFETKYNGYRFRSRLEAKYACFLDECGVNYEYETNDFRLWTGDRYLPDFALIDLKIFLEVKPMLSDGSGRDGKIKLFAETLTKRGRKDILCVLSKGLPELGKPVVAWLPDGSCIDMLYMPDKENGIDFMPCNLRSWNKFIPFRSDIPPHWIDRARDAGLYVVTRVFDIHFSSSKLLNAINVARSARFEFGEVA